ncbi:MAG: hypothetical protein IJK12_05075 [Clostridia bacterium]|nr:hypothetical protein [Clostridia bacterium]
MKRLFFLLPLLTPLACAGEANAGTLRSVILIAAGVISVVLLILFGKPKKPDAK